MIQYHILQYQMKQYQSVQGSSFEKEYINYTELLSRISKDKYRSKYINEICIFLYLEHDLCFRCNQKHLNIF